MLPLIVGTGEKEQVWLGAEPWLQSFVPVAKGQNWLQALDAAVNVDIRYLFCHVPDCDEAGQLNFYKFETKSEFNTRILLVYCS